MRPAGTALATALVVALAVSVLPQARDVASSSHATLPPGLAKRLGEELPEVVWVGLHPGRNDGAWVLLAGEWTLFTGFPAEVRAEVKEARKRPSETPPVRPPSLGVALHVVRFERR